MKITQAQVVHLASSIVKRINELVRERNNAAFVKAQKGEKYEAPIRTFDEISKELIEARNDIRSLDYLKAKANIENFIDWNGEQLSIIESIEVAKQLRNEANVMKDFGTKKKQDYEQNLYSQKNTEIIVYAQYDPETARLQGLKLERMANRLSSEIERKNHLIEIEFEAAKKYIDFE